MDNFRSIGNAMLAKYINEQPDWGVRTQKGKLLIVTHGAINSFLYHNKLTRTKEEVKQVKKHWREKTGFRNKGGGNLKKVGAITLRKNAHTLANRIHLPGYFIKTETGWKLYTMHVWETNFGPVPKGFMVTLKDRAYTDLTRIIPENLELVANLAAAVAARENLNDNWVLSVVTRKNPESRPFYAQMPKYINFQRKLLEINRTIKANARNTGTDKDAK